MKKLEKIELISDIGRELQSRMTYNDIASFLSEYGIDTKKATSNINSKWVYSKELLSGEPDKVILDIADELDIKHVFKNFEVDVKASDFWEQFHFKLFISHLAVFREKSHLLKRALRKYGISSFVAHDDIEPTREWQNEIENALFSMDALVALLTPDFNNSKWADQEIGIAIGQQKLVIPVRKGIDPYGFIGKFQGLNANGKTVKEVAKGISEILFTHNKTKFKMIESISSLILNSINVFDIQSYLEVVDNFAFVAKDILGIVQSNYMNSNTIITNKNVNLQLEKLFIKYKVNTSKEKVDGEFSDSQDEVPF